MKTTLKKLHKFFDTIITISTNQLYDKLQDYIHRYSGLRYSDLGRNELERGKLLMLVGFEYFKEYTMALQTIFCDAFRPNLLTPRLLHQETFHIRLTNK